MLSEKHSIVPHNPGPWRRDVSPASWLGGRGDRRSQSTPHSPLRHTGGRTSRDHQTQIQCSVHPSMWGTWCWSPTLKSLVCVYPFIKKYSFLSYLHTLFLERICWLLFVCNLLYPFSCICSQDHTSPLPWPPCLRHWPSFWGPAGKAVTWPVLQT